MPVLGRAQGAIPDTWSGATEVPDGRDNDCNGVADMDDDMCRADIDMDMDGFCPVGRDLNGDGDCLDAGELTAGFDCDDTNPASTTLATDADCDGVLTADDCDDNCNTCFPGSPATTSEPDLLDQNCDGNLNDYTGVPPKVCDLSATGQTASNGLAIPRNQMCQANGGPAPGNYQPQGMIDGCAKWCENGGSQANPLLYNPSAGTVTSGSVSLTGSGYPGFNWSNCHFLPVSGQPLNGNGRTGCQTVNGGYPIRTCTCNGAYAFSGYR